MIELNPDGSPADSNEAGDGKCSPSPVSREKVPEGRMRVRERSEALLLTFVFVGCKSKSTSLSSRPHPALRAPCSRRRETGWGGVPGRSRQPPTLATELAPPAASLAPARQSVARTHAAPVSGSHATVPDN